MLKKLPKSQIEFEIIVPWNDWKKYLDMAAAEASQEIKISGFRPGKAPRNLVEQKVGKALILNNAAEKAVKKSYIDYIFQEKLEIIGQPKIEILELEEEKDLKYRATAAIMPEIKVKEDYIKGIKKINKEFANKPVEVSEDDLKLELEKLANSRVKLITMRREARDGDSVEVDFEVLMDNVPIENGTSKKHPLILGRKVFIPGFEEQVAGMKEGEEKSFELNFPENYHQKNLAGKLATFKVKMNLVQERQTPEINDDFAKSLGKFENLEALKKNLREGLEHESEHKIKDEKRAQYLSEIAKNCEIELPELLIDEEIKRMLAEFEYQIQMTGMNLGQYLEKIKKNKSNLEKEWRPMAEKRIIEALALKEIAKMQNLAATAHEIEDEVNKTLQYYRNVKDMEKNIDMERLYNYSKGIVENEKVFEYLEKL